MKYKFKIPPNEIVNIGTAIAELDDDLKFDTLNINHNGSITQVIGKENIKKMFDRNFWGLKTPYNITIK